MKISDILTLDKKLLGERIRHAREHANLSQEQLAAALELGQRAISELENGKRRLSVDELFKLAEVLNTPIYYFLEGSLDQTDLDLALLKYFHSLPTIEKKQAVLEVIRIISQNLS